MVSAYTALVCGVMARGFYAQFFEVHTELGVRPAIERASCHDVVTSLADVEQGNHLRSHAAACGHSGSATFECRNTFFQYSYRGIGQAGVDVAKGLQVEQACCVLRAVKHIGAGLVNRYSTAACSGIGNLPCMKAQGVKTKLAISHGVSMWRLRAAG